jgi:hypothetical protein
MARNLTAEMIAEIEAGRNSPIFLYEGIFVGVTLRLWNGVGELYWDMRQWQGNGWLRGFQGVEENVDMASTGMDIELAGVPQVLISTLLSSTKQNASGKLWLGFLDSTGAVVDDPYLLFEGKLDVPTIDDQVGNPIIQISYEAETVDLDKASDYRYTPESQRIFYANDKGFDYVAQIAATWKGQWGPQKKPPAKKKGKGSTKTKQKNRKDFQI